MPQRATEPIGIYKNLLNTQPLYGVAKIGHAICRWQTIAQRMRFPWIHQKGSFSWVVHVDCHVSLFGGWTPQINQPGYTTQCRITVVWHLLVVGSTWSSHSRKNNLCHLELVAALVVEISHISSRSSGIIRPFDRLLSFNGKEAPQKGKEVMDTRPILPKWRIAG